MIAAPPRNGEVLRDVVNVLKTFWTDTPNDMRSRVIMKSTSSPTPLPLSNLGPSSSVCTIGKFTVTCVGSLTNDPP